MVLAAIAAKRAAGAVDARSPEAARTANVVASVVASTRAGSTYAELPTSTNEGTSRRSTPASGALARAPTARARPTAARGRTARAGDAGEARVEPGVEVRRAADDVQERERRLVGERQRGEDVVVGLDVAPRPGERAREGEVVDHLVAIPGRVGRHRGVPGEGEEREAEPRREGGAREREAGTGAVAAHRQQRGDAAERHPAEGGGRPEGVEEAEEGAADLEPPEGEGKRGGGAGGAVERPSGAALPGVDGAEGEPGEGREHEGPEEVGASQQRLGKVRGVWRGLGPPISINAPGC